MRIVIAAGTISSLLIIIFLCSCEKPVTFEQLSSKLLSGDEAASASAAKTLAGNVAYHRMCAAALAVENEAKRERFIRVFEMAGDPAMEIVLDHVKYVRLSGGHFDSFARYFKRRGPAGYTELANRYGLHSDALKDGIDSSDFGIVTTAHKDRMDDIARLILVMPDKKTEAMHRLILHPHGGARLLTAKLLCAKGWMPSVKKGGKVKTETIVYYNHLVSLTGCDPSVNALEKAVLVAGADFDQWIKVEKRFPAPGDSRLVILAELKTKEASGYVLSVVNGSDNPLVKEKYARLLKVINSSNNSDKKSLP